ncbi:MAG: hypothetical protein GX556_16500 [Fibrobacter sp.]|nr:hypothetical protein [Fibrobacter sp.]
MTPEFNHELAVFKGQLAELKQKFNAEQLEAHANETVVRNFLNPYISDITDLSVDQAKAAMDRLYNLWVEMRKRKETIDRLEKDLNG